MIFNRSKNNDFQPEFFSDSSEMIEVVERLRVLGVVLRSDLKWSDNTENMVKNAYSRFGLLRNLKKLGASQETLVEVWIKHIRCLLELAAPVWCNSLTEVEEKSLESVQAVALGIIMDKEYTTYSQAVSTWNLQTMKQRRAKLFAKFCTRLKVNTQFQHWLKLSKVSYSIKTRSTQPTLKYVPCNSKQYQNSAIPKLVNEINKMEITQK